MKAMTQVKLKWPVAQGQRAVSGLVASWTRSYPALGDYTTLAWGRDGEVAWWAGIYSADLRNEAGQNEPENGKFLSVLHRHFDGSWKRRAECISLN